MLLPLAPQAGRRADQEPAIAARERAVKAAAALEAAQEHRFESQRKLVALVY